VDVRDQLHGGRYYIGNCCGQSGEIQDTLNQIYREYRSGFRPRDLRTLANETTAHGDVWFQWPEGVTSSEQLALRVLSREDGEYAHLNPWAIMGLAWCLVRDYSAPSVQMDTPNITEDVWDHVDALKRTSSILSASHDFGYEDCDDARVRTARAEHLARYRVHVRYLMDHFDDLGLEPFDGLVIVGAHGDLIRFETGLAVFAEDNVEDINVHARAWARSVSCNVRGDISIHRIRVDHRLPNGYELGERVASLWDYLDPDCYSRE
jgi:hypothetical protein